MLQKVTLCPELTIDSAEKKVYGYIWGTSLNDYVSSTSRLLLAGYSAADIKSPCLEIKL